jgi:hypothetical protein
MPGAGCSFSQFVRIASLPSQESPSPRGRWVDFAYGFGAALLVACLVFAGGRWWTFRHRADPLLLEAWGPLANSDANVQIILAQPYHLLLKSVPAGSRLDNAVDLLLPPAALPYYDRFWTRPPGEEIHMTAANSHRVGEVLGAFSVIRVLDGFGSSWQAWPDRATHLTAMRARNVILFGDPKLEPAVGKLQERGAFKFRYDPSIRDYSLEEETSLNPHPRRFPPSPDRPDHSWDYFGLLTVLPSDGSPPGTKRTIVFAGANSSGCQAAAEFFSSPRSLRDLRDRFRKEGIEGFPRAYQVVVKSHTDGLTMTSASYAAHYVIDR